MMFLTIVLTIIATIVVQTIGKKVITFVGKENIFEWLKKNFMFTYDVISKREAADSLLKEEDNETSS